VTETIEYEQFEERGAAAASHADADLRRLSDIPMELSVEIGRTQTTVGETLDLRVGSLIELEREAGAPADLLVNGTPIARGEVVVVDASYGLRITEILDAQDQLEHAAGASGSAGLAGAGAAHADNGADGAAGADGAGGAEAAAADAAAGTLDRQGQEAPADTDGES
jgi:flagellar motor switch protein FliN/FliY